MKYQFLLLDWNPLNTHSRNWTGILIVSKCKTSNAKKKPDRAIITPHPPSSHIQWRRSLSVTRTNMILSQFKRQDKDLKFVSEKFGVQKIGWIQRNETYYESDGTETLLQPSGLLTHQHYWNIPIDSNKCNFVQIRSPCISNAHPPKHILTELTWTLHFGFWSNKGALQCIIVSITMIQDTDWVLLPILLTIFSNNFEVARVLILHINSDGNPATKKSYVTWKKVACNPAQRS